MTTTKRLTIWSIKNRWLRAAVAWLAFIAGCAALVPVLAGLAVWSAVTGAAREVRDACTAFIRGIRDTVGDGVGAAAWAAMTGKDEPA